MFFSRQNNQDELTACQDALQKRNELVEAITTNVPTIEFTHTGHIVEANALFLAASGYSMAEIKGKHHEIFCPPHIVNSPQYKQFWEALRQGESRTGTFERRSKSGETLWLEATYFPVISGAKVTRILKIAKDITAQKNQLAEQKAVFDAINRASAVIEFKPDGTILKANSNFTQAVGYDLGEIQGKHHRMFCKPDFYEEQPHFWQELARGDFKSGKFERIDKHGNVIWLEATYNPIYDESGQVIKVIKFASDITERVISNAKIQNAAEVALTTSEETTQIAERGADILQKTVAIASQISSEVDNAANLIEQLNNQSEEISKIVTTISSIADQTNLLALNAAIEAARAGDHGRGFAVVADEVRSLAARTSTSTVEIEEMVKQNSNLTRSAKDSMDNVSTQASESNELVNEAFNVIDEIRKGALNVSQTVSEIT